MAIRYVVAMSYTSRPVGMELSGVNMVLIKAYLSTYIQASPSIHRLPINYTSMVLVIMHRPAPDQVASVGSGSHTL